MPQEYGQTLEERLQEVIEEAFLTRGYTVTMLHQHWFPGASEPVKRQGSVQINISYLPPGTET